MAIGHGSPVVSLIRTLFDVGMLGSLTDGQLLERFESRRADGAEAAFEVLVARHGPMVWNVCRGVLGDAHAAEDAFQATFLIRLRKASSIRRRDTVGPWLYGVARRVAVRANADCAKGRVPRWRRPRLARTHPGRTSSS